MSRRNTYPDEILNNIYKKATSSQKHIMSENLSALENIQYICRCMSNRAGVRLLMSCMLAKLDTAYEMKMKRISKDDIDTAVAKITRLKNPINNYLFITTEKIEPEVAEYAVKFYEETGGTEIAILDCVSFLRHFLHLFHRVRVEFLNAYQNLVLNEPDSAVNQPLKEAFLALWQAAESSG